MSQSGPVFLDHSGRRWRRIRRAALVGGVISTVLGLGVALSLLLAEPLLPELHPTSVAPPTRPLTGKLQRERSALRRQFDRLVARTGAAPSARPVRFAPLSPANGRRTPAVGKPLIAGFYVNWDENSYVSLTRNLRHMDWVVCEWAFVDPSGDSLHITIDPKVIARDTLEPPDRRPQLIMMVSNYEASSKEFKAGGLTAMLARPAARARAIAQLRNAIRRYGLGGVLIDFEVGPGSENVHAGSMQFTRELRSVLAPMHKSISYAVPTYITDPELREAASVSDKVFAMVFDEHYGAGDPGPVASQRFYERQARRMVHVVPPEKLVLMIGAYGYDWNDWLPEPGKPKVAEERTFQDVVMVLRDSGAVMHFDPASLNPYTRYTSPDSTDHVIWFLDGATAYNEMRIAQSLGAAGTAVWRLGGEDPSLWRALGPDGVLLSPDSLKEVPPGYYPEIENVGEIIRIRARPTMGSRTVVADETGRFVTDEGFISYPTPFITQRYGLQKEHPHWVALTFDDGPDRRWTSEILDTLKSRHAPATFFIVGENADRNMSLLQRMYDEGHEVGNHTYSHPNLGLTSEFRTRQEIELNEKLIESVLDRRTALFRPPYFGDAEPTTEDEMEPVALASERHFLTIGLHVDALDWQGPPAAAIVDNVLAQRARALDTLEAFAERGADTSIAANVILLHDGGGVRANTVAAVGPLIDSLRAHGDTIVLVSVLAGLTRAQAMPPLAAVGTVRRALTRAGFMVVGNAEFILFWVFTVAVVLGIGRLVLIGGLAFAQRVKRHQNRAVPTHFAPGVSVIVPAFNEAKVIGHTVASLLTQEYGGSLEVVVVDDGSSDDTYDIAMTTHGHHPQVSVYRKPNGGKASALNYGIERARHEIVVCLDADTIFATDTVAELVQPLQDEKVGAVAGNAKVGNRVNLITRWQALEYVTSQNLDRRAFSLLDCITVVPGAVGAWRRSAVLAAGGFRSDTLAEDQDLTLILRRAGYSVAYADGAVGYTEAPDSVKTLAKQRFRWSFGTLQCAWKHRDALFRPKYGSLGSVALPNVWLFQLLLPAISPIADLMFVWSLLSVWMTWEAHGETYALVSLRQVLFYYAVFLIVDWLAALIAFLMEEGEDKALTWLILLQRFAYRQIMYWVVVKSFVAAMTGRMVGWGKLERKATVTLAPKPKLREEILLWLERLWPGRRVRRET